LATIIIFKPNKKSYNSFKAFWPIVLLNTINKLFKKTISKRLQFVLISNNFIHMYQLGGLKQRSTTDMSIALTYFIHMGWVKNVSTSILVFDILQFFLLLNHQLLPWILNKESSDSKVSSFFQNYLVGRRTKYFWNCFSSPFFDVDIGVGQESAFSSILSALYLALILHIFEKRIKNLSFVDDGLFIFKNKSLVISNANIFCSYNIISFLFEKFGLTMEHRKTEVFYFYRSQRTFTPSVKIKEGGLNLFYFSFHFLFSFWFIFQFSIFRTTRVRVDQSRHHISHLMAKSQDRSQDLGEFSRRFKNKWCYTIWTPHVDLMDYTWLFRVGCTVLSTDHL